MKLSVIMPVYNEADCIEKTIDAVKNTKLPSGLEMEIIIVDDFSSDGTRDILTKNFRNDNNIKIHFLMKNSGKGVALRQGFKNASGDILLIQDADLEYDPNEYSKLLKPILEDGAAVVYGSRFLGTIKNMRLRNLICNKMLIFLTNILYRSKITDQATGYKVFRNNVIGLLSLHSRRFEFCSEITAKILKKGFVIHEVPINYIGRDATDGKKIRWHDGIAALWALLKYRFVD